jgi:hypothetical protein
MEKELNDILSNLELLEPVEILGFLITRWSDDKFELDTIGDQEYTLEEIVSIIIKYTTTDKISIKYLSIYNGPIIEA